MEAPVRPLDGLVRPSAVSSPDTLQALRPASQAEILGQFSPEDQQVIRYRQQLLSSLAFFIGKDFRIPVGLNEPGGGWHWNFKENEIMIDPQDLIEKPLDYLRFTISHEGGHRRISRTEDIPTDVWRQNGFSFMMNAIEDPRTNNFVAEAYPRFAQQMDLAYEMDLDFEGKATAQAQEKLGYQPKFIQAGFEYIKQWFKSTRGEEFEIDPTLPDDVREVVEATLKSAQDSWLRYPSREEADSGEATIRKYANKSYAINRDQVWPEFKKLVDKDMEDQKAQELLQEMMDEPEDGEKKDGNGDGKSSKSGLSEGLTPDEQKELQEAMGEAQGQQAGDGSFPADGEPSSAGKKAVDLSTLSPELRQKIQDYIDALPSEERKRLEDQAREALGEFEKQINEQFEGKLSDNPDKKNEREKANAQPGQPSTHTDDPAQDDREARRLEMQDARDRFRDQMEMLSKDKNEYEKARLEMLPTIDELEADLREIFVQRKSHKWETGFKTGKRIDIKKRMQEKAKGVSAVESKAWQRRELPDEKDYDIALLLDLSASEAQGGKIKELFKSAVVIAEVLNRLSIRTAIYGFNDRFYVYQEFGQDMNKEIREEMGGMLGVVYEASRGGGNHHPQQTDVGWATELASEKLAKQKGSEKFLITLTDGQPMESPLHPRSKYELGGVVKRIDEETNQKQIGLGIGAGTDHVEDYYPNSIANIEARQLSGVLADVVREAIANYGSF